MAKKIALDWDESELRFVVGNVNGSSVKVTHAAVIPLEEQTVQGVLSEQVTQLGLDKVEALVAIGRGKAELRELQLPPVPADELPDMVRFQAIRSFASSGESSTVDFVITDQNESNTDIIAAAVGPATMDEVKTTCETAGLATKRIALRPLAASALWFSKHSGSKDETILVDLLADDAEIVIARDDRVVFVRTVRMPKAVDARPGVLAGELRRSLMACGAATEQRSVILWGRESVHQVDLAKIREATGGKATAADPFDLVEVDRKAAGKLPEHIGRLAPLVGLLASDETASDRLIDFLNPRKRPDPKSNRTRNTWIAIAAAAAVLLVGFLGYRQLAALDAQIQQKEDYIAQLDEKAKTASTYQAETEVVDQFLDGDVNWLREIKRAAEKMPASTDQIVTKLTARVSSRGGGGELRLSGAVTRPSVIDEFEEAVKDETHRVVGEGSGVLKRDDVYRWGFEETIVLDGQAIRDQRYEAFAAIFDAQANEANTDLSETEPEQSAETEPESNSGPNVSDEAEAEDATKTGNDQETKAPDPPDTSPPGGDETETNDELEAQNVREAKSDLATNESQENKV
ncbi:MAG: hypothetical protein AAGA03_06395 [Planctomycetota bacterium]